MNTILNLSRLKILEFVALAAPYILLVGLMLIVFGFINCYLWLPIILLVLLYHFNLYFECFAYKGLWSKNNDVKKRNVISLITYNVNLAYKDLSTEEKAEKIAEYLYIENADIIFLQEYNPRIYPAIQQSLQDKYQYGSPFSLADRYKAIYSKFPIKDYVQIRKKPTIFKNVVGEEDRDYLPICGMEVNIDGKDLYIINCHLQSNNLSPQFRKLWHKEISFRSFLRGIMLNFFYGMRIRQSQSRIVHAHLMEVEKPIIVCGDMNDVSGSSVLKTLKDIGLKDVWWNNGIGFGFTLAYKGMRWRLDHILYSAGIKIDEVRLGKASLSDHRPLLCKFYLI